MKPVILSLNASLRNGRWGKGVDSLLTSIKSLDTSDELIEFLGNEAKLHLNNFLEAGRKDGVSFDVLYKKLRRNKGDKGLCNSEIGLVAGLWGVNQVGCEIEHVPLSQYFDSTGKSKNLEELKTKIIAADGLLLVTPVYFGDRSSLASDFMEFLRQDSELIKSLSGKPMSGISVGAKRNGGQETTLIYQVMEMMNLGMLGLGNDTETTSQYGGTIVAGDIGTAAGDLYGLGTAIGSGRRLGRVAKLLSVSSEKEIKGKIRVLFWILQDKDECAKKYVSELVENVADRVDSTIMNLVDSDISRCIACDICPTHIGKDAEYRCINKRQTDAFVSLHEQFLDYDMIVPVAFSPIERSGLKNVYQRFIERTRYLRRGDYLFSDVVIMPLVFNEVGSAENLQTRMITSLIRHHTIVVKPNIGHILQGELLNQEEVSENWCVAIEQAQRIAKGRMLQLSTEGDIGYNPVGYLLSLAKNQEDNVDDRRKMMRIDRKTRRLADSQKRMVE